MDLRRRLDRIERDVATRAEQRAAAAAALALIGPPTAKRQFTVEELHAAFEQYMPEMLAWTPAQVDRVLAFIPI